MFDNLQIEHLQIDLPSTMFSGAGKGQNRQARGRASRVDVLAWEHCPWLDNYVQGHCHGAVFGSVLTIMSNDVHIENN